MTDKRQGSVALHPALRPQPGIQVLKTLRHFWQLWFNFLLALVDKIFQRDRWHQCFPVAGEEMIPNYVEGNRRNAAKLRTKIATGYFHFRQAIGHDVNPAMHADPADNLVRIKAVRIATYEVCQQVTQ